MAYGPKACSCHPLMSMRDFQTIIEKPGGIMLEYIALLSSIPPPMERIKVLRYKQ